MPKTISIRTFITLVLAFFAVAPLAAVLGVTLVTAGRNTADLLRDKTRLVQDDLISSAERYLLPAEAIPLYLADMLEAGEIDPGSPDTIARSLTFALAGAPEVQSVAFLHREGWMVTVFRDIRTGELGFEREAWTENAYITEALQDGIAKGRVAYWGDPLFIDDSEHTIIYFAHILREGREFQSAIAASVELAKLSNHLEVSVPDFRNQTFILSAEDRVIAHHEIGTHQIPLSPDRPVPDLSALEDTVMRQIWLPGWEDRKLDIVENGHVNELSEGEYIYLYEPLSLTGLARPWLIGGYLDAEEASAELDRLFLAAMFGLSMVVLAVLLALKLGQSFAQPTIRLADAATSIERLEFDQVPALPTSRLKEVDGAFRAFERMTAALSLFGRYVPKRLVQMLLARDGTANLPSEESEVTIMFADIIGFTRLTACMPPKDCAAFLNEVFSDLTTCIEQEGGTVDKFIGDAVMAFWGAPEPQSDHAARACRAALAIRDAVLRHNEGSQICYGLRLGLHSGRVTVGNIGPSTRMNYTIVGTPVSTAQRLEQLGKLALEGEQIAILASRDTIRAAGFDAKAERLGAYELVAGGELVEVLRL